MNFVSTLFTVLERAKNCDFCDQKSVWSCDFGEIVQLIDTLLSGREVCASISGAVKSDTASSTSRHRCDVFSF